MPIDLRTTEYRTAGEPLRIVLDGVPPVPCATAGQRLGRVPRRRNRPPRRLCCQEPRGHADICGCLRVPPDDGGVLTAVVGTAFPTGEHRFVLDPLDTGFVLR